MKMAAAAAVGTVLALGTGASAQGGAPHVPSASPDLTYTLQTAALGHPPSDSVVPMFDLVPVGGAKCTGAGTLPGNGPFCYAAKIGMLGVTETLDLTVHRTTQYTTNDGQAVEKGTMDLVGSGVSPFKCNGVAITKTGQDVSPDMDALKHCLPRGVTLEKATYCSDTNAVQVSIKDSNIPVIGSITKQAESVKCPSTAQVSGLEGIKCKVCSFIMNKLIGMLPVDAGEQKIEGALDKVCAKLPGIIEQPCESFVAKETDVIVQGLMNHLTPEAICAKVHAC